MAPADNGEVGTQAKPVIEIFTDGACSPNPGLGGWAAILRCPSRNEEKTLTGAEENTTNNRMELTAAVEALQALKKPSVVTIHTDSEYLANAFNQKWLENWQANGWITASKKPVKNADLWQKLIDLTQLHVVKWSWVRGHADNEFNERCDRLAVQSRLRLLDKGI